VKRLKGDFPALAVVINGGITRLEQAKILLRDLDGVMIGRAAYRSPWLLAAADREIFGDERPIPDQRRTLEAYIPYLERELAAGVPPYSMTRHLLGLFQGQPGARRWRRTISESASRPKLDADALMKTAPPIR
jgi:tRNA-dihydrouridine synthase A